MSKKVKPFRKIPKHKWLASIIRIDTPAGARKAVSELTTEWNLHGYKFVDEKENIYVRKHRGLLIKATSEAIRRCKAQLQRKHLSTKERKEFKQIVKIYANWLKKHRLGKMKTNIVGLCVARGCYKKATHIFRGQGLCDEHYRKSLEFEEKDINK